MRLKIGPGDITMQEISSSFRSGLGARAIALAFVFIALAISRTAAQENATTLPLSADEATAIATDAYISMAIRWSRWSIRVAS